MEMVVRVPQVDSITVQMAVKTESSEQVVAEHVLERIPHIFNGDWNLYRGWRAKLASLLKVDPCNISLTGSACVGVSFSPHKNFSEFGDSSDIDVAVISPFHFDLAWRTLRAFRLVNAIDQRERRSITQHQTNYIYWGCIATDRILRLMPFCKEWTIAASQMQGVSPTEGREINFRMYRDYESLRQYQLLGVEKLQTSLLPDD